MLTDLAEAASSMDRKRRIPPTPIVRDAQALLLRGIDALERNHIDEAVGLLRQTVQLDAESFHGHLALGIALTKALEIPAAEQALETAIELDPRNFYAHLRLAELFHRVGVPTRMKEELQMALDLAENTEQKKIARDLLNAEERRNVHRAWRPDFSRILSRKRPK
jgi:cytochrome c-type biogenesis protein CcmH/NrfG